MVEKTEASPAAPAPSDFQAAVAAEVQKAVKALRDEFTATLLKARKEAGTAAVPDDMAFAEKMAMAIATLTDQGTGRKRVAPEILEQRAKANAQMLGLIAKARAEGKVPSYTLKNKVYLDEVLVDPIYIGPDHKQHATEIEWPGVPSEAMRPANDVAKDIYVAYKASIGSIDKDYERPLGGVTAKGLVVRSRAGQPIREVDAHKPGTGLRIAHRDGRPGERKHINVLGTVAEPAEQSA